MSEVSIAKEAQAEQFPSETEYARGLLDQLLIDSKLYKTSKDYLDLLNFTVRMRNMAPFNAMLLQIQKPGMKYAASANDWKKRFDRTIKEDARPLLIMWPFGPVALVYDFLDTEGDDDKLPKDAFSFYAKGKINEARMSVFATTLKGKSIHQKLYDQGDCKAGYIRRLSRAKDKKKYSTYELAMNRNHTAAMRFVTLAHELGHLYLGHLGKDGKLGIQERSGIEHRMREIEAESVAYIVCNRNGVECRSQNYLNAFVLCGESTDNLDIYAITRAAGQVERILRLSHGAQWNEDDAKEN